MPGKRKLELINSEERDMAPYPYGTYTLFCAVLFSDLRQSWWILILRQWSRNQSESHMIAYDNCICLKVLTKLCSVACELFSLEQTRTFTITKVRKDGARFSPERSDMYT